MSNQESETAETPAIDGNGLGIVSDVPVDLEVSLGTVTLSVEDLVSLEPGTVVALDQQIDEPVTVRLNGRAIATGQIVVAGDHYGVRITRVNGS